MVLAETVANCDSAIRGHSLSPQGPCFKRLK